MVIPQYDYLKQLSVSHESYHSDEYLPEQLMFSLPSVGRTNMTSILYFPFSAFYGHTKPGNNDDKIIFSIQGTHHAFSQDSRIYRV
jgi:hypothetical protein